MPAWLTPQYRRAIYIAVAIACAVLLSIGVLTKEMIDEFIVNLGYVIGALVAILAAVNAKA